jgi:hypothetical protein
MYKIFLLILMIFTLQVTNAQTKGKSVLYGYKQNVLPGVNRGVIGEYGEEVDSKGQGGRNYFIYISSASRIYPAEMWIKGEPYSISMEIVRSTPVTRIGQPGQESIELVPRTDRQVLKLVPTTYREMKNFGDVRSLAAKNELVVVYKQNGKFFYNSLVQLADLDDAAMQ